ncbi:MAG TPA: RNA methyltransferase [Candidatus Bathyarchaeia archaeon]|nr:RNA methyltransferase [Candidatus Bathyarchaeia archaeon]
MTQPARRSQIVSVALPASLTLDIPHLREKTARLGFVSRALATFRVEEAIIYRDRAGAEIDREARLIEKMLTYIETPQYLRRLVFKMDPDLQYAGTLPPLRTPNHPDKQNPSPGLLREGVVVQSGPSSMVEAGFRNVVRVKSKLPTSDRITIRLTRISPELEGEIVEPSGLTIYWGFRVARGNVSLSEIVRNRKFDLTISTSRKGTDVREITPELREKWKSSKRPLIVFGSPSDGVPEILARSGMNVSDAMDFDLNIIPDQGVETVRTEEALWGSLAVINVLEEK